MPFTVTYNGNGNDGGTVPVDPNGPHNSGDIIPLQSPDSMTRTGARFAYWNTKADGTGTFHGWPLDSEFPMPAANIVLFAQWFITTGLDNAGVTQHFKFSYDSSQAFPAGPEPGRTRVLMNVVENDFSLMADRWFPGVTPVGPFPFPILITRLNFGSGNFSASSNVEIRLNPGSSDVNELRSLIVSEFTERFMQGQNKGWGFLPGNTSEESCGEALSLFLTQQFELSQRIAGPYTAFTANGWLNSSLPVSNSASSRFVTNPDGSIFDFGSRADYVNSVLPFPGNGPGTGCSILFIYYLFHQFGFSIPSIIANAPGFTNGVLNAIAPLRGVYQNLTKDPNDPFPRFFELLEIAFPPDQVASIPGPNPDDPWPLSGSPLLITGSVRDTAGVPITDAFVSQDHDPVEQIRTDANGVYSTGPLASGIYVITVGQEEFVKGQATVTLLDQTVVRNFVLPRTLPLTISGQVVDTTGAPVGGATVGLRFAGSQTADEDGEYAFSNIVDPLPFDGNVELSAKATGFVSADIFLSVPNGAVLTQDIVLTKQGTLSGHVTGVDGRPLGGATISVGRIQAFTDLAGLYTLTLNPGGCTGNVTLSGFDSQDFSVTIPIGANARVDFTLVPVVPGSITGKVTDDGGNPLPAKVSLGASDVVRTGPGGTYLFTGLFPGTVLISVSSGIHFLPDSAKVTVIAGETVEADFALVNRNKL